MGAQWLQYNIVSALLSTHHVMQDSSVVSTQLLGASSSVVSAGVAEKLAHKIPHAAQFFVSCTLTDPLVLPPVESWLIKHFQQLYKD